MVERTVDEADESMTPVTMAMVEIGTRPPRMAPGAVVVETSDTVVEEV